MKRLLYFACCGCGWIAGYGWLGSSSPTVDPQTSIRSAVSYGIAPSPVTKVTTKEGPIPTDELRAAMAFSHGDPLAAGTATTLVRLATTEQLLEMLKEIVKEPWSSAEEVLFEELLYRRDFDIDLHTSELPEHLLDGIQAHLQASDLLNSNDKEFPNAYQQAVANDLPWRVRNRLWKHWQRDHPEAAFEFALAQGLPNDPSGDGPYVDGRLAPAALSWVRQEGSGLNEMEERLAQLPNHLQTSVINQIFDGYSSDELLSVVTRSSENSELFRQALLRLSADEVKELEANWPGEADVPENLWLEWGAGSPKTAKELLLQGEGNLSLGIAVFETDLEWSSRLEILRQFPIDEQMELVMELPDWVNIRDLTEANTLFHEVPTEVREVLYSEVIDQLYSPREVQRLITDAANVPNSSDRETLFIALGNRWARDEPNAAMNWAMGQTESYSETLREDVAKVWRNSDPHAFREWIKGAEDMGFDDAVLYRLRGSEN